MTKGRRHGWYDRHIRCPDFAQRIDQLSQYEIDQLPFGVVLLYRAGTVKFYSATEARQSGYGTMPLGHNSFDISRDFSREDFREKVMDSIESGAADLDLGCSAKLSIRSAKCGFAFSLRSRVGCGCSPRVTTTPQPMSRRGRHCNRPLWASFRRPARARRTSCPTPHQHANERRDIEIASHIVNARALGVLRVRQ